MNNIGRRSLLRIGATAAAATVAGGAGVLSAGPLYAAGAPRRSWSMLERFVDGDVVLPGDDDYERAIQLQVAEYDKIRPQAVLYCQSNRDVQAGVLFAQYHGIAAVPRSGGHNNAGYSTTEGLVLDVSRMNAVSVGAHTTRIGAGIQAVDALDALTPHGVAVPNGTCATVAAGGFVTGGGTGPFTRKHGVAPDNLRAARVVLADGRVVTCDADRHPELLWAISGGGGGNFGVITEYTLDHVPVERMGQFRVVWPWDDAAEVITGLQEWVADLPREIAGDLLAIMPDGAPGQPVLLQIVGTALTDPDTLATEIDRLVGLVSREPTERNVLDRTYRQTMMSVWGCSDKSVAQCHRVGFNPEGMLPRDAFRLSRSRLLEDPIPRSGVEDVLGAFEADRQAGQIRILSMRIMGGRTNEVAPADTAFVHRGAFLNISFTFGVNDVEATQEEKDTVLASLHDGFATFDPYSNGHTLQNFVDPYLDDWRDAYYGTNYARLSRVKRDYDPYGFFRFDQAIS